MDPLSITASVTSLIALCAKIGSELKGFYDGAQIADMRAKALVQDVEGFIQVLAFMKQTLEDKMAQTAFRSTGHIGNHWRSISVCITDGQNTLESLRQTLCKVYKNVNFLADLRKHLRYKSVEDEIGVYHRQIRTCRDMMQLSIRTVILWNQISFQESQDQILPGLSNLIQSTRRLAIDINKQKATLQELVDSMTTEGQARIIGNLEECVRTTADLLSSASTSLGLDDKASVADMSDFGDILPPRPSEMMIRWMSDNSAAEAEAALFNPSNSPAMARRLTHEEPPLNLEGSDPDSDEGLEMEIINAQLNRGLEAFRTKLYRDAEQYLNDVLSRLNKRALGPSEFDIRGRVAIVLMGVYYSQSKWVEAKSIAETNVPILSGASSTDEAKRLTDLTVMIAAVYYSSGDTVQGRMYCKRCIKGYRKHGLSHSHELRMALKFMIEACSHDGDVEEAEGYTLMLEDLLEDDKNDAGGRRSLNNGDHEPVNHTQKPAVSPVKSYATQALVPGSPAAGRYRFRTPLWRAVRRRRG